MKQREARTDLTMLANISDGTHVFEGMVADVSREGLRMGDVPAKFDFYADKYTAVISHKGENFKFHLKPRWSKTSGPFKEIGFLIISPPLDWIKFINRLLGEEVAVTPSYRY